MGMPCGICTSYVMGKILKLVVTLSNRNTTALETA
jgi:hypothetical protein